MSDFQLGINAKAYIGAADTALASLTEFSNITSVTLNFETGEADVTTRANSGFRATAGTLKECSAEFEMVWKTPDANLTIVRAAWLAGTTFAAAFLTGARSTAGSEGPLCNWSVTNFSRGEELEGAITHSVTLKCASFTRWVEDGV